MRFSGRGPNRKAESMTKWIPCGSEFIGADVVRWKESVWERRSRRRNARVVNVGERVVTAEVLRVDAEGWVHLLTRACAVSTASGFSIITAILRAAHASTTMA